MVGGVEVSTDGASWHPADGGESWTYNWVPTAAGTVTIRSRAVDDSLNLEIPGAGVAVTVGSTTGGGNHSIWPPTAVPAVVTEDDAGGVELGVKFRAATSGSIKSIRFYKGPKNTGVHVGSLWSAVGALLATATFTGETASGWQQVDLAQPVAITAGQTYVASYHTTVGFYSVTENDFATDVVNGPLTALASTGNGGNGVYAYGGGGTVPTSTYALSNYWIDVVFAD